MLPSALAGSLAARVLCTRLVLLPHGLWPRGKPVPAPMKPPRPPRDRKPFAGPMHQPGGRALCARRGIPSAGTPGAAPSPALPPRALSPGRAQRPLLPAGALCEHGRVGGGNIRANSSPQWTPLAPPGGRSCPRHFLETPGPPFPATQGAPAQVGWALAALAAGRGLRAGARVGEVEPHPVPGGLGEAAAPLEAFAREFLRDVHVAQGQRAARVAFLRAGKDGEGPAAEALQRLARSPPWVGGRWPQAARSSSQVTWVRAPWPWRTAWSIGSPRGGRRGGPWEWPPLCQAAFAKAGSGTGVAWTAATGCPRLSHCCASQPLHS